MKILYAPAVFLFIAIFGLPYGYYTFLRLLVTGVSLYAAFWVLEERSINFWIILFIGLLFNPLIPIHLSKDIWVIINIITGSYFAVTAYMHDK